MAQVKKLSNSRFEITINVGDPFKPPNKEWDRTFIIGFREASQLHGHLAGALDLDG